MTALAVIVGLAMVLLLARGFQALKTGANADVAVGALALTCALLAGLGLLGAALTVG